MSATSESYVPVSRGLRDHLPTMTGNAVKLYLDLLLNAITAISATNAWTVGQDSGTPQIDHWNGSKWSIQTTPNVSGGESNELQGVSCPVATACTAVGNYTDSSGVDHDLAEVWNGTSWSFQTTADPSGQQPTLNDVACTTSDGCTAVGEYTTISSVEVTLVEVGPSP